MHQPKKILLLIDSLDGGGAERIMSYLANQFDRRKYSPSVGLLLRPNVGYPLQPDVPVHFLCDAAPPVLGKFLISLISFLILPLALFSTTGFHKTRWYLKDIIKQIVGGVFSLRRAVREHQPDAIVVFLQTSVVIALLTLRLFKNNTPIICSDRILLSRELRARRFPKLNQLLIRWLYKRANFYIAVSEEAKKDMEVNFGLPPEAVETIYNGLDIAQVIESSSALRDRKEKVFSDGKIHFISVGRLAEQKGYDLLIRAFHDVCRKVDCRLILIGDGERHDQLRQLVREFGLTDAVVFAGWKKNPFPYLASADVFVMSSRYEGFPNALMEAMALQLPVISTDCPSGPAELLEGGHFGLLVRNESVSDLSEAMSKMAINADLRKQYAELAYQRIQAYSVENMLKNFEAVLDRS